MVKPELAALFKEEHIDCVASLPFSSCRITNARLYEKKGFAPQSVLVFLIPYFSVMPSNFSAYAAAEDYHAYAVALYERMHDKLTALYPEGDFLGFADHSPIDERDAAIRAGLGVFGKNRLLLSREYGSYQFIGEFLSTLPASAFGDPEAMPFTHCIGCNACLAACPTGILRGEGTECLSAITQKKGALTEEEKALMRKVGTAWGCDECQKVCPYTKEAIHLKTIKTNIPYFKENLITKLTTDTVLSLTEEEFRRRAFSWRGKEVVLRNTKILEEK